MEVRNNTTFPVIAFCFDSDVGYGNDVTIQPNETADVKGPYLGEMGGGSCHVHVGGSVVCQEGPDDKNGFQVLPNQPLSIANGKKGITVRHCEDEVEGHVQEWRLRNS